MKIVGATEYAVVLYRDKLPKFNNGRRYGEDGKVIRGSGKMVKNWFEWTRDNKKEYPKCHPTQKPVDLMEYLIKTYTQENETVLDFTMGSGSTGVACKQTNRNFIGIEQDEKYFKIAQERINSTLF